MTLRGSRSMTTSLSESVSIFGRQRGQHTWRDYLVADTGELRNEVCWGFNRTSCTDLPVDNITAFSRKRFMAGLPLFEKDRRSFFS